MISGFPMITFNLVSLHLLCNDLCNGRRDDLFFSQTDVIELLKFLFKTPTDTVGYPDYLVINCRKVKWARIQVHADGKVQMVVPLHYTERDISHFFQQKQHWIEQKRAGTQRPAHEVFGIKEGQLLLFGRGYDLSDIRASEEVIDHDQQMITSRYNLAQQQQQESWYRKLAKAYLSEQIEQLAYTHGYSFSRLFIRAQRTRWGSCSAQKNISLNWKLVKAPIHVSDYVILHELVHTRIMNHSPAFWREVEQLVPDYRAARTWLRTYGAFL